MPQDVSITDSSQGVITVRILAGRDGMLPDVRDAWERCLADAPETGFGRTGCVAFARRYGLRLARTPSPSTLSRDGTPPADRSLLPIRRHVAVTMQEALPLETGAIVVDVDANIAARVVSH